MEAGITKSYYCKVSRVENDAGFNAMEEGITKVIIAACVYSDENDARFIAMEAVITNSYYCNGTPDVNDACLIAMEAGIYMIITATHPVMQITLVSHGAGRLGAAVWAPPFRRRRLGAGVWAHGRMDTRRLGAGRYEKGT